MSSILHLIETGGPGGAENVFLELATKLHMDSLRTIAAVGKDGWLAAQARQRGLDPLILQAQGSLNFSYLGRLLDLIRQNDIKLVIAHLFGATVYASLAGILTRTPVISILHDQTDVAAKERFGGVKRWIVSHGSSRVVFVSAALQSDLQAVLKLPTERCAVIENGIDVSRYDHPQPAELRHALGLPASTTLIGAIGNVRKAKGYETLLAAANVVCQQRPDVHFVIAGDTSGEIFPPLKQLQEKLDLTRNVHFLGMRSDVPSVLADVDLFVLSSHTEGFSLALVEAMAAGRAAIATRSGGPETIVEADRAGILVPPRDATALAAAILRVLRDDQLKDRLAASAKQAITERFSSDRMVANYRALAADILRR